MVSITKHNTSCLGDDEEAFSSTKSCWFILLEWRYLLIATIQINNYFLNLRFITFLLNVSHIRHVLIRTRGKYLELETCAFLIFELGFWCYFLVYITVSLKLRAIILISTDLLVIEIKTILDRNVQNSRYQKPIITFSSTTFWYVFSMIER